MKLNRERCTTAARSRRVSVPKKMVAPKDALKSSDEAPVL
jgi:hypothetical protein